MGKNPNIFQDNTHQIEYNEQREIVRETFIFPDGQGEYGAHEKSISYNDDKEVTEYFSKDSDMPFRTEVVEFNPDSGDYEMSELILGVEGDDVETFRYSDGEIVEHTLFSPDAPNGFEGDTENLYGSLTSFDVETGETLGTDVVFEEDGKYSVEHYDDNGVLTSVDHLVGDYSQDGEQSIRATEYYNNDGELIQTDFFNPDTQETMHFDKDGSLISEDGDKSQGFYDKDSGEMYVGFESNSSDSSEQRFYVYQVDDSYSAIETHTVSEDGTTIERTYTDGDSPCGARVDCYDSEGNLYCTELYDAVSDDGVFHDRIVEHYIDGETKEVEYQQSIGDGEYETIATETLPIDNADLSSDSIDNTDVAEETPVDIDSGNIDHENIETEAIDAEKSNDAGENFIDNERPDDADIPDDNESLDDSDFDDNFDVDFGDWGDD